MSAAAHAAGKFVGLTSSNLLVNDLVVKSFQPLMTHSNLNVLGSKHPMNSLTKEFSLGNNAGLSFGAFSSCSLARLMNSCAIQ